MGAGQRDIEEIVTFLADFAVVARDFGVDSGVAELIDRQLAGLRDGYGG